MFAFRANPRVRAPRTRGPAAAATRQPAAAALGGLLGALVLVAPAAGATPRGATDAAVTWGDNYHGQLGQIFKDDYELSPVPVEGVSGITEIAAGSSFDLALLGDGSVIAWGGNLYGELGDDTRLANWQEGYGHVAVREWVSGAREPSEFPALTGVKQIAAGGVHGLALMQNGTVKAWGSNEYGQLGDGRQGLEALTNVNQRVARTVEWPAIEKTENVVFKGATKQRTIEVGAGKLTNVIAVAVGGGSDFALTSQHTIEAWGSDTRGQLGLDLTEPGPEGCETEVTHYPASEPCGTVPRLVEWTDPKTGRRDPLKGVKAIAAGQLSAYALLENGHVFAWGDNREGQLGTGATTEPPRSSEQPPAEVRLDDGKEGIGREPISGVTELTAGYDDVLARVVRSGQVGAKGAREQVLGWGGDGEGALTLETGKTPVVNCRGESARRQPEPPEPIACVKQAAPIPRLEALHPRALAAGNDYGLALSDGSVYSWGRNEHGELGNGKLPQNTENPTTGKSVRETGYPEPAHVQGFGQAVAVTAGTTQAAVLVEGGTERPAVPVTVRPEPLALGLEWGRRTASGAEVVGQKLNYRLASLSDETSAAEEGSDPEEETGPPVNVVAEPPAISGVQEGEAPVVEAKRHTLKVQHGGWSGARPITFEYQWERCSAQGPECIQIDREGHECASTGCPSEYSGQTLVKEDVGYTLRATVIAHGPEGQGTASAEPTEPVVLEEEAAEKTTELGKDVLSDPFEITRTLERLPLTESQKQKGERRRREVSHELQAAPYELKLTTREVFAGEERQGKTRTMIATPLPLG